jgi:hypothetical protein
MQNKMIKLATVFITLVVFAGIISMIATAQELPPAPPGDAFGGGSSGSGSTSVGGSYNPPAFQPYTTLLKSSDGSTIGRFEGKDFNTVLAYAARNATVNNVSYELSMEGELSSKPSDDCWLDFNFLGAQTTGLPPGMEDPVVLGAISVTKKPEDWSYKGGSPKYTLKIAGYSGDTASGDYYIVRSDGSGFQLQKASVDVSDGVLTVRFTAPGDTGVFTLMKPVTAAPTPEPTSTPVPTPTPTPTPENSMWSFPILVGMFAVGAIVGASAIFFMTRK